MSETTAEFRVPVGRLLRLVVPSIVVGMLSALTLWGLSALAKALEHLLWDDLGAALGLERDSPALIVGIITLAGLAIGLVVAYAPGHAGPDPATTGLVERPLPLRTLPGLSLALVIMLASGVSLGPENPIMAINAALVVAIGARLQRGAEPSLWVLLATAGTIGAMFGTPLAAALMFTELNPGDARVPLWDRLFAPLVAAGTGAWFMLHVADLSMVIDIPDYTGGGIADLGVAIGLAVAAAALGLLAAYAFTPLHRLFHAIRHPVLTLTVGGLVLGGLGVLGGVDSLFKGLEQMQDLPGRMATTTAAGFLLLALVKLVALLVASASGFRGGRIFPASFVGVALGFAVHQAWSGVPLALAVAATTTGIVVAVTRSGWLTIFLVLALVPDLDLLVPALFATLAATLVVTNRRELRADPIVEPVERAPVEPVGPVDGPEVRPGAA